MMKATAQLTEECQQWRFTLRHLRDQYRHHVQKLEKKVLDKTMHLTMWEVEHLHNQFYIQLINIHDLKKAIKRHADNISRQTMQGGLRDDTVALHCFLNNDFDVLRQRLKSVSDEFRSFLRKYPPAIYA
jgi:SPX domain protein involved in polyphosphate accumulation